MSHSPHSKSPGQQSASNPQASPNHHFMTTWQVRVKPFRTENMLTLRIHPPPGQTALFWGILSGLSIACEAGPPVLFDRASLNLTATVKIAGPDLEGDALANFNRQTRLLREFADEMESTIFGDRVTPNRVDSILHRFGPRESRCVFVFRNPIGEVRFENLRCSFLDFVRSRSTGSQSQSDHSGFLAKCFSFARSTRRDIVDSFRVPREAESSELCDFPDDSDLSKRSHSQMARSRLGRVDPNPEKSELVSSQSRLKSESPASSRESSAEIDFEHHLSRFIRANREMLGGGSLLHFFCTDCSGGIAYIAFSLFRFCFCIFLH